MQDLHIPGRGPSTRRREICKTCTWDMHLLHFPPYYLRESEEETNLKTHVSALKHPFSRGRCRSRCGLRASRNRWDRWDERRTAKTGWPSLRVKLHSTSPGSTLKRVSWERLVRATRCPPAPTPRRAPPAGHRGPETGLLGSWYL
jgi:hypothetical protein